MKPFALSLVLCSLLAGSAVMICDSPVQASSVIRSIPHPGPWGHGLTWDGQYLWSSDYTEDMLYQLDPTDGNVTRSFAAPGPDPQGLAWDGQYLWYADSNWSDPTHNYIAKLDPTDGSILRSFKAPGSSPMGLEWDGQYLWNVDLDEATIYKLDPEDGSIIASFPSPSTSPYGIAWDGQYLWLSDWVGGKIYELDPTNCSVVLSFDAPGDCPFDLAFDGQYLWNLDYPSTIYQIDIGKPPLVHDVTVIEVTPSTNKTAEGETINITVVLQNIGNYTETFNVTVSVNATAIETQTVSHLPPTNQTVLTFNWNTTGFPLGNYTVKAETSIIPGETHTADNVMIFDGHIDIVAEFLSLLVLSLFMTATLLATLLLKKKRAKSIERAIARARC